MKLKFLKLNENARIPERAYDRDFCYDVWATSVEEIAPNVYKYGLGFALQIERTTSVISGTTVSYISSTCFNEKRSCNEISMQSYESPHMIPISNTNLSIDIRPRSSVWKTGMVLCNCEGTVDEGYQNEICMIFYHVFPNMPKYEVGDKIGQIKIGFTPAILEFEEVSEFNKETERGKNGFGSSGNK